MAPSSQADASAGPGVRARRIWAIITSFITAGAGHALIGETQRGFAWLGASLALLGLMVGATYAGSFVAAAVVFVGLFLVRLLGVVDVARRARRRREVPPLAAAVSATALILAVGYGCQFLARARLTEAFEVPAGGMAPTLLVGDHFLVAKQGEVRRGDVVVFGYPPDPKLTYVKRVVALGGDEVALVGEQLVVNGEAAAQSPDPDATACAQADLDPHHCRAVRETIGGRTYRVVFSGRAQSFGPRRVPEGHAFVLGDNRDNSNDSRVWGTVPLSLVHGRGRFVWWSVDSTGRPRWSRLGNPLP
jgi:signal peptidase I